MSRRNLTVAPRWYRHCEPRISRSTRFATRSVMITIACSVGAGLAWVLVTGSPPSVQGLAWALVAACSSTVQPSVPWASTSPSAPPPLTSSPPLDAGLAPVSSAAASSPPSPPPPLPLTAGSGSPVSASMANVSSKGRASRSSATRLASHNGANDASRAACIASTRDAARAVFRFNEARVGSPCEERAVAASAAASAVCRSNSKRAAAGPRSLRYFSAIDWSADICSLASEVVAKKGTGTSFMV